MKTLFILLLLFLTIVGCGKKESKFFGRWVETDSEKSFNRTIELNPDHSGLYYFINAKNVRKDFAFKWELQPDDKIKVVSPGKPIFLKIEGSQLVDPDNYRYNKK